MQPKRNPKRSAAPAGGKHLAFPRRRRVARRPPPVPLAEMDALFEDVLLANDLAYDGLVDRGRSYLEARLDRASGLSAGGDDWADELVCAYQRILARYCRGVRW